MDMQGGLVFNVQYADSGSVLEAIELGRQAESKYIQKWMANLEP